VGAAQTKHLAPIAVQSGRTCRSPAVALAPGIPPCHPRYRRLRTTHNAGRLRRWSTCFEIACQRSSPYARPNRAPRVVPANEKLRSVTGNWRLGRSRSLALRPLGANPVRQWFPRQPRRRARQRTTPRAGSAFHSCASIRWASACTSPPCTQASAGSVPASEVDAEPLQARCREAPAQQSQECAVAAHPVEVWPSPADGMRAIVQRCSSHQPTSGPSTTFRIGSHSRAIQACSRCSRERMALLRWTDQHAAKPSLQPTGRDALDRTHPSS
jgi:hypothetical protein